VAQPQRKSFGKAGVSDRFCGFDDDADALPTTDADDAAPIASTGVAATLVPTTSPVLRKSRRFITALPGYWHG
jgi:hypothetical protein